MHYMRVTIDFKQIGYIATARTRYLSHVITGQINQHQMFGFFLFVFTQV